MTAAGAAALYRKNLPPGRARGFPTHPIDPLNAGGGEPLCYAQLEGLGTEAFGQFTAYGYGTTADEAARGAAGELTEETHNVRTLAAAETVRGSYSELKNARGDRHVLDPRDMALPAGSPYTPDTPLTWCEATRHATGEAVLVPAEFLAIKSGQTVGGAPLDPAAELTVPITNGLGAGTNYEMAVAHGCWNCCSGTATARGSGRWTGTSRSIWATCRRCRRRRGRCGNAFIEAGWR